MVADVKADLKQQKIKELKAASFFVTFIKSSFKARNTT